MEELIEFRLDQHEKQINSIREHNEKVNLSLANLNNGMSTINENISENVKRINDVSNQVKILNADMNERAISRKLAATIFDRGMSALKTLPYFIILAVLIYCVDLNKFSSLIHVFH